MINLNSLLIGMSFKNSNGIENVDVDKDGYATKVYSDLVNNNLSIGIQPPHEKHNDYKDLGIIDFGDLYPKSFGK